MAEIVNLRQARKRAARVSAEAEAAENRRLHGRPKAERLSEAAEKRRRDLALDGHRLERADTAPTESGEA